MDPFNFVRILLSVSNKNNRIDKKTVLRSVSKNSDYSENTRISLFSPLSHSVSNVYRCMVGKNKNWEGKLYSLYSALDTYTVMLLSKP